MASRTGTLSVRETKRKSTKRLANIPQVFGTLVVIEPSPGQLTSDAGLLPIRQFDERIGLSRAFILGLDALRDPDLSEHTFLGMVGSRV